MFDLQDQISLYTVAVQKLRAVPLMRLRPETRQAIQHRISARVAQLEQARVAHQQSILNPQPVFFPSLREERGQ
jgi:hypothetical protein